MRGEFDLIARYFAPLAGSDAETYGLRNDAAVTQPPAGRAFAATLDTMVAGVHFLPDDPAGLVARKLLRVNLSDLAAMGARPYGYLLSLSLSRDTAESWVADFTEGLKEDQARFGCRLLGGDTTSTPGPVTLSLTMLGHVEPGQALSRAAAREGDLIFLSGTLGDAALGLKFLQGDLTGLAQGHEAFLADRYRLPRPRVELGVGLAEAGLARAAIDVSDGLAADLGHLCDESGLGAEVDAGALPLSDAAAAAVSGNEALKADVVTGGDDYELLFTADPQSQAAVERIAGEAGVKVTPIGRMTAGRSAVMRNRDGRTMNISRTGWTHF